MASSLVDQVSRRLRDELNARRAAAREAEVAGRVDHTDAQARFEARRAQEDAERQRRRGPTVPRAELERRENEKWETIATLRNFRSEIATERQRLIAAVHAAVERGDLEDALAAQQRLTVLNPVDGVASSRLLALGVEK